MTNCRPHGLPEITLCQNYRCAQDKPNKIFGRRRRDGESICQELRSIPVWLYLYSALLSAMFCYSQPVRAQQKSKEKDKKITVADFDLSKAVFDHDASAVVLEDIGHSAYVPSSQGGFKMVFSTRTRVKILNKNGFAAASQRIALYGRGDEQEKLSGLKASTYTLEGGEVIETKLNDKDIYTEKINKELVIQKFTLPALKEGSIFEVSYTITSEYFARVRSWDFQGAYPCLYSEYEVVIPEVYNYMVAFQGDQTYTVDTVKSVSISYFVPYSGLGVNAGAQQYTKSTAVDHRWVKTNIPALKSELYTSTIANHISRISFQLHYTQYSAESPRRYFLTDWFVASRKLMDDENFGGMLETDNRWLKEPLSEITRGVKDSLEKAKLIFRYLRNYCQCNDHDALYGYSLLKDVYKKKTGNVAEINLLLTAMLRFEGLDADPGILSTRENGFAHPSYPLINEYNYVICHLRLDDKTYNLDASCAQNGFNYLPAYCYNGEGRVINRQFPSLLAFFPDSLYQTKATNIFIQSDEKGNLVGSFQAYLNEDESFRLRHKLREIRPKEYFDKIQKGYGTDYILSSPGIDSVDEFEKPIRIHYDFMLDNFKNKNVIYFNPMFEEKYSKNPFTGEKRSYDVEMPYAPSETFVLNMQIPEGFKVDELPKSVRAMFNNNEDMFEYLIGVTGDMLQLRVTLQINKAIIPVDEYDTIRNFYAAVVKKENEQIVFRKINGKDQ